MALRSLMSFIGHKVRSSQRNGFTLVEVMMAAAIMGLGVLGLIALFAGAARQQQQSSQITTSLLATKSAEALLGPRLGELRGSATAMSNLQANEWFVVPMHPQFEYLTVSPDPSSTGPNTLWLEAESTRVLPYPMFERPAASRVTGIKGFAPVVDSRASSAPQPYQNQMKAFPDLRVIPDSVRIRVLLDRFNQMTQQWEPYTDAGELIYGRDQAAINAMPGDPIDDPKSDGAEIWGLYLLSGGNCPAPRNIDFIQLRIPDGITTTQRGFIRSMNIEAVLCVDTDVAVASIEVTDYRWKNDAVASMADRIYGIPDASHPRGLRPQISYSVLYRRLTNGDGQMAMFTYSLQSPQNNAIFVPQERIENLGPSASAPPIREIELDLYFDNGSGGQRGTERYYFLAEDTPAERWVVQVGQLIMVKGDNTAGFGGSDDPVRVVGVQRDDAAVPGSPWRLYLDRSPRFQGQPLLPNPNSSQTLRCFAVNDIVTSLEDGSTWKLRPLEVRLFQLGR